MNTLPQTHLLRKTVDRDQAAINSGQLFYGGYDDADGIFAGDKHVDQAPSGELFTLCADGCGKVLYFDIGLEMEGAYVFLASDTPGEVFEDNVLVCESCVSTMNANLEVKMAA